MSEGELKKQIGRFKIGEMAPAMTDNSDEPFYYQVIFDYNPKFANRRNRKEPTVSEILDEAKKEIPKIKGFEWSKPAPQYGDDHTIEFGVKWGKYMETVEEWFKKWFGDILK